MRIYLKTESHEKILSEEYNPLLSGIVDICFYNILQASKYKLMWHLRKLEDEINESEGVIIIECLNIGNYPQEPWEPLKYIG